MHREVAVLVEMIHLFSNKCFVRNIILNFMAQGVMALSRCRESRLVVYVRGSIPDNEFCVQFSVLTVSIDFDPIGKQTRWDGSENTELLPLAVFDSTCTTMSSQVKSPLSNSLSWRTPKEKQYGRILLLSCNYCLTSRRK